MDTSYLAQQVTTIIGQLHGLFDEIGIPSHERDSREAELFSALSDTLHSQLKQVTNEKHKLTEDATHLIQTIKQMEASLDDSKMDHAYHIGNGSMKVSYPLTQCLQTLQEKCSIVSKLHRERFEQVRKLVEALQSYAEHLETSFVQIKLPPTDPNAKISPSFDLSPSYVTSLDSEFTRVYEEYVRRVDTIKTLAEEIIKMWAELGTPQAQTDSTIVEFARDAPEQLGLRKDDIARLKEKRDKLVEEKRNREKRLKELRFTVESLWEKLGIEEHERKGFIATNRGCGLRIINEFESELNRLNELKRQNMHLFVEDARFKLQDLWDTLYFSEEEMLDFTPAFSDVYSDALLAAHEAEIERLEALKEQRLPILQLIDKHRTLVKDRDDLQASSQDASRLMARGNKGEKRDPTRLLREEKMRKRIAKDLPKIEADLRKTLENWENEYGRPFLVHGCRYLDELHASSAKVPPPRSKTPSVPAVPPAAKGITKSASQNRPGTIRGAPPRSKTPVANASAHLGRQANVRPTPSAEAGNKSPSRIPLKNMPQGNNSPERNGPRHCTSKEDPYSTSTIRKMGPPNSHAHPLVPPPKMKNLFMPPPQTTPNTHDREDDPRSASMIRSIVPEDVYDDRSYASYIQQSMLFQHQSNYPPAPSSRTTYSTTSSSAASSSAYDYPRAPPPPRSVTSSSAQASEPAGSRQISNSSSITTAQTMTSGSENWETYDDASDPEDEGDYRHGAAATTYHAKLKQQQLQQQHGSAMPGRNMMKRGTPDDGYAQSPRGMNGGMMKKVRGLRGEEDGGNVIVVGEDGEAGGEWEDDEAY